MGEEGLIKRRPALCDNTMGISWCRGQAGPGLCLITTRHRGMDVVLSAKGKEKEARKVKEPANKG